MRSGFGCRLIFGQDDSYLMVPWHSHGLQDGSLIDRSMLHQDRAFGDVSLASRAIQANILPPR